MCKAPWLATCTSDTGDKNFRTCAGIPCRCHYCVDGWLWTPQYYPHHRRCGVGCYTDTQERVFCALPGLKQSVYRAELHAVARALEECSPH
eukprot:1877990-Amphidinium_carterae.1